jgi:hypothetical protein
MDAKGQKPLAHRHHIGVLAQQQRAMLHGQVDELLVVCIAACQAGFGRHINLSGVLVKFGENGVGA